MSKSKNFPCCDDESEKLLCQEGNAQPVQVAQSLNIGRTKVYDLINREGLPTVKLGTAIRVPATSLKSWIERREQQQSA